MEKIHAIFHAGAPGSPEDDDATLMHPDSDPDSTHVPPQAGPDAATIRLDPDADATHVLPGAGPDAPTIRRAPDTDATRVLPGAGPDAPTIRRAADADATRVWGTGSDAATIPRAADPDATRVWGAGSDAATIRLAGDPDATRVAPDLAPPAARPLPPRDASPRGAPDTASSPLSPLFAGTGTGTGAGAGSGARRTLAPIALPPGYRLHEYRIDDVLGQGSFGITYLATDVNLNTRVAIKEYLPAEFAIRTTDSTVRPRSIEVATTLLDGLDQFLVEARTLATFRHGNIVRVARFFEANRTAYMVMDYERGSPLLNWWAEQFNAAPQAAPDSTPPSQQPAPGITEADLVMLLNPLLDGLALVHRTGVLHRDIKPGNICVRESDGSFVLLDFGAARPASGDLPDAPSMLTPGYAPIEQYVGDNQGPWTDLYAMGATLYWMVSGKRPREAVERKRSPQADISAEQAGAGRFGPDFLRAIDWALQVRAEDRPRDVGSFRRALFAAHASSLGLQEALAGDADAPGAGRGRGLVARLLAHRALRPGSWPLVVKMVMALVLAAVLPMSITAWYNYTQNVDALANSERRNLERLALATSGRLSQLVEDSRKVTAFVAAGPDVADLLAHPADADKRALLLARLASIVGTNTDLHLLTLMDARGTALVSTAPEVIGGNYAFREYYKVAMGGHSFVTSIIVGSVAGRAGVYIAYPVLHDGQAIGVVTLRLRAEAINAIVDGARNENREPFLVDGDGVLLHHRIESLRFHSLAELRPEAQARIAADQRFRLKRVVGLGMPQLASAMIGARSEGTIDYESSISKTLEVAGFAPIGGVDWVVGVTESRDSFEAPLRRIFVQLLLSVAAVGTFFVLLAIVFARSISRPVQALTHAADALKRGDYDAARVRVTSGDEIGALGRTFNVMIDVLRQREREHGLREGRGPEGRRKR
ncbi:MAG: protein kinase domain-containing protein [Vitreoscilla sp.]